MHNQPPHTLLVDQIVGRLLQLWRADSPITLSSVSSEVMMKLQFDQEDTESRLTHATAQESVAANTDDLRRKLEAINEYLNIGQRIEATLTNAIQARRQNQDTAPFTIVLHIEEKDPYQHEEGLFTTACIYKWASQEHGIKVPEWAPLTKVLPASGDGNAESVDTNAEWQNVRIRILANERISFSISDSPWQTKLLSEVGLTDGRNNTVNKQFAVLLALASGRKFGIGKKLTSADKACKSKLCNSLRNLTGVKGEPFLGRSESEGYMPHFSVEDRRNDASDRIARNTTHVQYQESLHQDADDQLCDDD